jgi:Heterokaryon incompatibility protein (HET)
VASAFVCLVCSAELRLGKGWATNDIDQVNTPGTALSRSILSTSPSKTIKGAIRVCQDIGIRYLWVDALCITQDDNDPEKMRQIKNLHHIYMNASVTIVATFGDSANAGLPGVDPDSNMPQQLVSRNQGMTLVKQGKVHVDTFDNTTSLKHRRLC